MRKFLSALGLYLVLLVAQVSLIYAPELSESLMRALGYVFVGLFPIFGSFCFMQLEKEILPKDIFTEAKEIFSERGSVIFEKAEATKTRTAA